MLERLQVTNVPARNPDKRRLRFLTGVQVPPKLSAKVNPWNVETPSVRPVQYGAGITVRRAVGVVGLRGRKKLRPSGNPEDRVWKKTQR